VLAGEAWNEVARDVAASTSPAMVLLLVSWVIIGQFVLLNLFLAVTLSAFSGDGDEGGGSGGAWVGDEDEDLR